MMAPRLVFVAMLAALAGCGGEVDLTCDEVRTYQLATPHPKVRTPENLDDLDPLREMPLPEASPQEPRPPGSPCIDLPPTVIG